MLLLYYLEGIRTPALDTLFSWITHFGEETLILAVGLMLFWCINKREGYYLMCVGLMGTVFNQLLKMYFRIPRPWVRDSNFTIVESARAAATGYSFPSGHTQTSVGLYGCIGRWSKRRAVRIFCVVMCILVPISRMYLGVHTPWDVSVSVLIALALVFGLYPILHDSCDDPARMRPLLGIMALMSITCVLFMHRFPFPADTDLAQLDDAVKNTNSLCGAILGLFLTWELDHRFIRFETAAPLRVQAVKLVVGLALVLGVKALLKPLLLALCSGRPLADLLRYFIVVVTAGCAWPLAFPWLSRRLGAK